MQWKVGNMIMKVLLLVAPMSCLRVGGYPYQAPRTPSSFLIPGNYLPSSFPPVLPYSFPASRAVICSSCSCDDDFFCARNCDSCKAPAQDPSGSSSSSSCVASSGPASGKPCIFPFIYNGVQYNGCTQLINGLASVYSNPIFWCSTKVDVNGFHVRGPWDDKGKHV